jgi:hypothetical protein
MRIRRRLHAEGYPKLAVGEQWILGSALLELGVIVLYAQRSFCSFLSSPSTKRCTKYQGSSFFCLILLDFAICHSQPTGPSERLRVA